MLGVLDAMVHDAMAHELPCLQEAATESTTKVYGGLERCLLGEMILYLGSHQYRGLWLPETNDYSIWWTLK
jgi:hypothetical protein